jgi:hypothetical protein
MGYPYNTLIAPAILWENPRVTREEFAELLDRTHSSNTREYKEEEDWDFYNPRIEDSNYHDGIEGVAYFLCLGNTEEYLDFVHGATSDENGLTILPPYWRPLDDEKTEESGYRYELVRHIGNEFDPVSRSKELSWDKLKVGSLWEETMMGAEKGVVTKIYSGGPIEIDVEEKELLEKLYGEPVDDVVMGPQYEYDMDIRPVFPKVEIKGFKTMEDLWEECPLYNPANSFDWTKSNGHFRSGFFGGDNFLWEKKGEKYSLDKRTFDLIPSSIREGSLGFTDLILTRGALRHNAWKMLSYKALQHFPQFLNDFPDVRAEYDKAIWDSQNAADAKEKKMTTSELMRKRMLRD